MNNKFGIICCENAREEVDLVLSSGEFPDVIARSYTVHCMKPQAGGVTIEQAYDSIRDVCDTALLIGCGCTFNLEIPPGVQNIVVEKGASLFLPRSLVEHYYRNNAYLVIPGWLARWPHMMVCQGLSRETARQMFGETIREIVLVDTGTVPGIGATLSEFSQFLDIQATRLPAGLDFFRLQVENRYTAWPTEKEITRCDLAIKEANRKSADYAMVFDFLGSIAGLQKEEVLIREILELYNLLFSPGRVSFIPQKTRVPVTLPGTTSPSPGTGAGIPVFP